MLSDEPLLFVLSREHVCYEVFQDGSWWEIDPSDVPAFKFVRAVVYYRHSARDRQESLVPSQQDQVRAWAIEHSVEIIREFRDAGRSGLN